MTDVGAGGRTLGKKGKKGKINEKGRTENKI